MAGIFDVFTILFQSETEDATKGVDQLDKNVDELARSTDKAATEMADLGQKAEQAASSQKSFLDMVGSVAKLTAGYMSMSAVIGNFVQSVNMADQLDEFTGSVDGNIEKLSAWGDAVKMNGGDMASFQSTFQSLSADFTSFAVKGKSKVKPFFDELGISMVDAKGKAREVMDVLPELADAFEGLSKQESLAFGKKMGLDGGTIRLLQSGRKEMDELIKRQQKLGVITAEQGAATAEFNDALDDTAHAFRSVYLTIATEILPVFSRVLEAIQDVTIFLREHKGFAIGFFGSIAAVIAAVYLPAVISAIIATAAMVAPFLPVIAAVGALAAALGLMYDDFVTWKEGGKSMIGELVGDFDKWTPVIEGWKQIFNEIKDVVTSMWDAILNPLDTLGAAKDKLLEFVQPIKDMMPSWGEIKSGALMALENVNTPLSGLSSAAMGAGSIANSSTVSVGKVEVNTQATDAEGISRDIGAQLGKQLRQTAATYDDGVAY